MTTSQIAPWTEAMYAAAAASRRPLDRERLLEIGSAEVPAKEALRVIVAKQNRRAAEPIKVPTTGRRRAELITRGQRYIASQALLSGVRWGALDRDEKDRFSATPRLREQIRAARRAR